MDSFWQFYRRILLKSGMSQSHHYYCYILLTAILLNRSLYLNLIVAYSLLYSNSDRHLCCFACQRRSVCHPFVHLCLCHDWILATASVMAPKLPLKWLSAWFQFCPSWLRPSFNYRCKWNLVLACRSRSEALLSGPSWKWLRLLCNMTAVLSSVRQWLYTEHVTAHISLLSKPTTSLLHCCRISHGSATGLKMTTIAISDALNISIT